MTSDRGLDKIIEAAVQDYGWDHVLLHVISEVHDIADETNDEDLSDFAGGLSDMLTDFYNSRD